MTGLQGSDGEGNLNTQQTFKLEEWIQIKLDRVAPFATDIRRSNSTHLIKQLICNLRMSLILNHLLDFKIFSELGIFCQNFGLTTLTTFCGAASNRLIQ